MQLKQELNGQLYNLGNLTDPTKDNDFQVIGAENRKKVNQLLQ